MAAVTPTVAIPGKAIGDGADALAPISNLLTGLSLLGSESGHAFSSPDQGVAALESTATTLSKWWAAGVAALGSGTAIFAAIKGFWASLEGGPQAAALGSAGVVLAAAIIGVAIIVRSDLQARATAQSAIYSARATIAQRWLDVTYSASAPAPAAADASAAGAGAAAAPAGCSCDDIIKLTDAALKPVQDALTALTTSVGALPDDVAVTKAATDASAPVTTALKALQDAVGDLPKHSALVTLGALQAVVPNARPIVVKNAASGYQGQLKSVGAAPIGDDASKLHVRVDDGSEIAAFPLEQITDF